MRGLGGFGGAAIGAGVPVGAGDGTAATGVTASALSSEGGATTRTT